jgi:hypothetical protein
MHYFLELEKAAKVDEEISRKPGILYGINVYTQIPELIKELCLCYCSVYEYLISGLCFFDIHLLSTCKYNKVTGLHQDCSQDQDHSSALLHSRSCFSIVACHVAKTTCIAQVASSSRMHWPMTDGPG